MKISTDDLRELILNVLSKKYNKEQSALIADVVLFAELAGKKSHGILRLLNGEYGIMEQNPFSEPEIIEKTKVSALIKGNGNPGPLVGSLGMKKVIELAKENGFGLVGTNESFSSSGCMAYYLKNITDNGLIGITFAQSAVSTPPHGGIEPLFGTNPISFGIPTEGDPIIFDMATSAITFGEIIDANEKGIELPKNVAIDADGNMTTDPKMAMEGATLAFDNSYKGSGLAMMVEILGGLWTNASYASIDEKKGWGNLFMAFSPDLLMSVADFKEKAKMLVDTVRNSRSQTGRKIRIPGENVLRDYNHCLMSGEIDVDEYQLNKLKEFVAE